MIYVDTANEFLNKNIKLLLELNSLFFTDLKEKSFFTIEINNLENSIQIKSHDNQIEFINTPFTFEALKKKIITILFDKFIIIGQFKYYPITQTINYNDNNCILGSIHNSIISNLALNFEFGIKKEYIYQLIWPKDKNIQMNKLDTHLTNLKNKLKKKLQIEINIKTIDGKLRLLFN